MIVKKAKFIYDQKYEYTTVTHGLITNSYKLNSRLKFRFTN